MKQTLVLILVTSFIVEMYNTKSYLLCDNIYKIHQFMFPETKACDRRLLKTPSRWNNSPLPSKSANDNYLLKANSIEWYTQRLSVNYFNSSSFDGSFA